MNDIDVKFIEGVGGDLSIVNSARCSFGKWKDEIDTKDERLISYLGEHEHMTPFRHNSLQFMCVAPVFLARQLMKHQSGMSWNEMSMRYVDEPLGYFEPESWRSRPDKNIKQGSGEASVEWVDRDTRTSTLAKKALDACIEAYDKMLEAGVAPELARMVLPQRMMVRWVWTGNLLAFSHVYNLRIKENAQYEARVFAKKLDEQIPNEFRIGWDALINKS